MNHLRLIYIFLILSSGCASTGYLETPDAYLIVDGKKSQMIPGSSCWIDLCDDKFFSETPKHPVVITKNSKVSLRLKSYSEIKGITIENISTEHLETFLPDHDWEEMEVEERHWWEEYYSNHIAWQPVPGKEEDVRRLAEGSQVELPSTKEQDIDLELAPGHYILSVLSWWSHGDASFEILLQVEP